LLAEAGEWAETVCFYLAVRGTGGETPYLRGVRRARAPWAGALRELSKRLDGLEEEIEFLTLTDVALDLDGCPRGYREFTLRVAELVTRTLHAAPPSDAEDVKRLRRSLAPGGRRAPSRQFAPLVWRDDLTYEASAGTRGRRRGGASSTGTALRYPSRLLTDPYARAFHSGTQRGGGVVVLDQSGSMDLTREEVERVARRAPGAWVIGYSHRPGDTGGTPNVWVLAGPQGLVVDVPAGNVGNGVDGPVLRHAITLNRSGGRIYWVTDGQVTDSQDHPCEQLSRECAELVRRHRVTLIRSVEEIGRPSRSGDWARFGRLGAALLTR
ncbi:MAG: VWA domain-containing protein, partial [Acidimicrobiaceae bacterium]|nr:VWA domain-containing protein [Acidimicrobiaceae bacterium]